MVGSGGFGFVVDLRTLVIVAVIAIAAIAWFVRKRRSTTRAHDTPARR